jgi:hypothetical protein
VRPAIVEVPVDDVTAYADALLKLRDDCEFYQQKQQACIPLQEQFYDTSRGWGARLKSVLLAIQESKEPAAQQIVKPSYQWQAPNK